MAKRKTTKPAVLTPPIQDKHMFYTLCCAKPAVAKLRDKGKAYDPLIDQVLIYNEEGENYPTSKELQARLKVGPHKLRKWLEELTDDFVELIAADPLALPFPMVQVSFSVASPGQGQGVHFKCQMPTSVIPRIGERLLLPFIPPALRLRHSGDFFIHDVEYELRNGSVYVSVAADAYNPLISQLAARARFEGKLTYEKMDEMGPYLLEQFLKGLYGAK